MDETSILELFRTPVGSVPVVDLERVKTAWERVKKIEWKDDRGLCAVAGGDYNRKPDVTAQAIGYRAAMLGLMRQVMPQTLAPWTNEDQLDDAVFRAIAEVPMEWIEGPRQDLPFDIEDFMRRVREAAYSFGSDLVDNAGE
jgi:hypothetical protein